MTTYVHQYYDLWRRIEQDFWIEDIRRMRARTPSALTLKYCPKNLAGGRRSLNFTLDNEAFISSKRGINQSTVRSRCVIVVIVACRGLLLLLLLLLEDEWIESHDRAPPHDGIPRIRFHLLYVSDTSPTVLYCIHNTTLFLWFFDA